MKYFNLFFKPLRIIRVDSLKISYTSQTSQNALYWIVSNVTTIKIIYIQYIYSRFIGLVDALCMK